MPSSYTLGSHYENFVRQLVESGRYASASEVVRDGLRALEEQEQFREAKLAALKAAINDGLQSGEATPFDIDSVKAEARKLRMAGHKRAS